MKFAVMRYWQLCDRVEVEANTRDEAIEMAHKMSLDELRGNYVSGSLKSDPEQDVELIAEEAPPSAKVPVARFRLGRMVATPNALSKLSQDDILNGIQRHQAGDWGDVDNHDRQANDRALGEGTRIWSVYHTGQRVKFYVITEADRSYTTVLLPEDY